AEHARDVAPLIFGDRPLGDDVADQPAGRVAAALQQVDDRQRHLAFAQIADQLERHPEVEAELAERELLILRDAAEDAADLGAAAEEVRGLAADDLEMLFLADLDVAGL